MPHSEQHLGSTTSDAEANAEQHLGPTSDAESEWDPEAPLASDDEDLADLFISEKELPPDDSDMVAMLDVLQAIGANAQDACRFASACSRLPEQCQDLHDLLDDVRSRWLL